MKEENIRVLVMEPGKEIEERLIPNTLEALQELVGGRIEVAYRTYAWALLCDEEGKLKGKDVCRTLFTHSGIKVDELAGTLAAVGIAGEDFRGLTDGQIGRIREMFAKSDVRI